MPAGQSPLRTLSSLQVVLIFMASSLASTEPLGFP